MKNQTERRASERNYYVDGNTVRRMEAVPDYRRERREREEREREEQLRRRKRQVRRNQERQLRMSKRYVVFLTMAVTVFGVFAGTYIKIQSDMTARMNTISSLESQIADLKADSDWEKLIEGAGTIGNSKLIIDDTPGISIAEMRSKCRKYKLEHDLKLIIIDYLQLMSGSGKGSDSRQQEISDISRSLKALARELSVPVIALSQLSRAVEQRPDHRPMLSDLRESGAIEQDADVVMFIYRDDYYNHDSEMKGISEIIIAKQRNGPIGTVNLVWLPQYTKFANMEKN